jgi:hypothetical protein
MRYAGRRVEWRCSDVRETGTVVRKEGNWLRVAQDLKNDHKGQTMEILIRPGTHCLAFIGEDK